MTQLIHSALPMPRRSIVQVDPLASAKECINLMVDFDIGALLVGSLEKPLGIVSERDILRECLYKNLPIESTPVKDIAYPDVSILTVDDSIDTAMALITQTKRRHVLIKEQDKLVAILSIGDVLFYLLKDKNEVIKQLENYIYAVPH